MPTQTDVNPDAMRDWDEMESAVLRFIPKLVRYLREKPERQEMINKKKCAHQWQPMGLVFFGMVPYQKWQCIFCQAVRYDEVK